MTDLGRGLFWWMLVVVVVWLVVGGLIALVWP
jgi:hypothetical protein